MKLDIRHTFPCTVESWWASFWDEDLDAAVANGAAMHRDVLSAHDETGGVKVRRYRFATTRELPSAMKRALGSDTLAYEQTTRIDPSRNVIHWEVHPSVLADKVKAAGTLSVRAVGNSTERAITGEVTVRIPLIGSTIEGRIADAIAQSYAKDVDLRTAWLRERGLLNG